ncbi:MAG: tRNA (adenosine(37)-N6)-dimethylallyltransferase MiaA [Marinilabiliales bacterium]|nr:MAG: tRNA (adenosine(37)-N6)-dimethylallyltransferase MiaA [Marinilabiliales bacterium]
MEIHDLIVVLGPTACGKTALAVQMAASMDAEIIGADSRQVYRGLDIGTGKDLAEYNVNDQEIPYHLIDILDPGQDYNAWQFQRDALDACIDIQERGKLPLICGGTGLYIESFLLNYPFNPVEPDANLRAELEELSTEELAARVDEFRPGLSDEDRNNRHRVMRMLETELSKPKETPDVLDYSIKNPIVFGIDMPREIVRQRISDRLKSRLDDGMIAETEKLLRSGVDKNWLFKLGLEYRFLSQYILGELTYDEMYSGLETSIHRFAKRQMTWFRRMEKRGIKIHWIDGMLGMEEKLSSVSQIVSRKAHEGH